MGDNSVTTQRWILHGGSVIDGTGRPRYRADVVLSGGSIEAVAPPGTIGATGDANLLDVSGHVVAPGFIDMHAHSDLAVLADKAHLAKVAQGVTLEVLGQDGLGYFPVTEPVLAQVRSQIAGWNGEPDLDYSWRTVGDYLARVDQGCAVNAAVLVPHGTVRMTVIGTEDRPATTSELEAMRDIVAAGLRDGAMGMSTGLTYTPGMYASDEEIVHALGAVAELGGYYCPHHRNYGADIMAGYQACLDIAAAAGVPLHLAHSHVNHPQNKGRAGEVLAAIDQALNAGVDITLDTYPYLAGATYLSALLPSWMHQEGPIGVLRLLDQPDTRRRVLRELEVVGSDGNHGLPVDWTSVVVSSVRQTQNQPMVGHSIASLGEKSGRSPGEVFCDLLVADELGTGCIVHVGNEENVRTIMGHSAHTVGSDGILIGEKPHPRGWGTFPRFLGTYARELGLMSMEEAVMHATSRPARRLGLSDRGVVAQNCWADLVVFDPERIASEATYEHPTLTPTGIRDVFVNGVPVLLDSQRTGHTPGIGVRRPRPSDVC